jgi:cytochrome c oxidase assembly factor CtaG
VTGRATARWGAVACLLAGTAAVGGWALGTFAPSVGSLYGLGDLGGVVDVGLPAVRAAAIAATAVTLGQLLVAAVYVPGAPDDIVSPDGYRALRAARVTAALAALAALAATVLTVAENTAIAPGPLLARADVLTAATAVLAPAAGWALTAAGLLVVAGGAALTLSWRGSVGLLLLGVGALGPMTLTTSTDAERSHDILGDAMTVHGLAAALWLGSGVAVALHVGQGGAGARTVLRRHGVLATGCLLLVAASGLVVASAQIAPRDLFASGYGLLVTASVALAAAAAAAAHRVRVRVHTGGPRTALGVLAVEATVLAVASVTGTALVRVFPPDRATYTTTRMVYLIGYELPPHLTAADLALFWRWDVLFGTAAVLAAAGYLLGVRRLRRACTPWPAAWTASWLAGCVVLLLATSSGVGAYAPAVFSVHMVQHMLIATLVPVLLVLGHGVTLALHVTGPTARARALDLLDSPAVRCVRSPAAAWTAVAVTLFGLYATGLYAAILQEHWAHLGMNVAFLGTGLALYWPVLGHRLPGQGLPPVGRIVMVFAVMGLHAAFAAWLLSRPAPIAGSFFASMQLPYVPDLAADQRRGAVLAWALGEVPTVIAVAALVRRWSRTEGVDAAAVDRASMPPVGGDDGGDVYPQPAGRYPVTAWR